MRSFDADRMGERILRRLAGRISRRSLLARLGTALVAAPVFPLLPVRRAVAAEAGPGSEAQTRFARNAQAKDDTKCDYWRYCALGGYLCSCCGGGVHTCPAGAQPSPTSWIGTCINPADERAYLIAYRDCCGKPICGQCYCHSDDHATQLYVPQTNDEIEWCFGLDSMIYHCSTAVLVGLAE